MVGRRVDSLVETVAAKINCRCVFGLHEECSVLSVPTSHCHSNCWKRRSINFMQRRKLINGLG